MDLNKKGFERQDRVHAGHEGESEATGEGLDKGLEMSGMRQRQEMEEGKASKRADDERK